VFVTEIIKAPKADVKQKPLFARDLGDLKLGETVDSIANEVQLILNLPFNITDSHGFRAA
jgi:hypothetical protein